EMTTVGHVTALALPPFTRGGTPAPLLVGILEQLAVDGEAVRRELMAARAELGPQVDGGRREAVVRKRGARLDARRRSVPARRAEALIPADVAARAHEPLGAKRGVERRVRRKPRLAANLGCLLGEWRVTGGTRSGGRGIALAHLHELARDARPHAL